MNELSWDHYLSSKREYIVATMDVRGSSMQSNEHQYALYHHLGELEVKDIIDVTR